MSKPDLRKRKEQPVVIVGTILGSVFLAGAGTILFLYRNFAPRADVQEVKESIREFDNRVRTLEITSREMGVTIEGLRQATLSGVRVIQRRPPQQVSGVGTTPPDVEMFRVAPYYDPSGLMGDTGDVAVAASPEDVVRFNYETKGRGPHEWDWKFVNGVRNPNPAKFAGVMWLNPPNAWGDLPECGYDLRRFRGTVVWEARSIGGRVNVEFLIGGVTWLWKQDEHGKWFRSPAPYGDSMPRISLGIRSLSEEWQPFEASLSDLPEENFTRVVGAFGWTASWSNNAVESNDEGTAPVEPKKLTFEIRDLRYKKETGQ